VAQKTYRLSTRLSEARSRQARHDRDERGCRQQVGPGLSEPRSGESKGKGEKVR